jgi:hypothetical protein
VEQPAIQHCVERAPQTLKRECIGGGEPNLDAAVIGLLSGDRQGRLSYVNAKNRQSQRGDVKSVLTRPAARVEHSSRESAIGGQPHYCRLRPTDVPGRRAVVIRRVPWQPGQPFVTGWAPTTERIVGQLRPFLATGLVSSWWHASQPAKLQHATPFPDRAVAPKLN